MIVLGIETSCDDTSVCLLQKTQKETKILSHLRDSQEEFFSDWGGVVPELAARNHLKKITPLLSKCFENAKLKTSQVDIIGVTAFPGLLGPLLTGINAAKSISLIEQTPIVAVNHLYAHLEAIHLSQKITYPYLGILVSGGHSAFFYVTSPDKFELIAQTIDDAAGEAFDKGGKMLGLGYPAGHIVDQMAKFSDSISVDFPIGLRNSQDARMSFSGLKTSLRIFLDNNPQIQAPTQFIEKEVNSQDFYNVCASYQKTIIESLSFKLEKAIEVNNLNYLPIVVGGGVACNSYLRKHFKEKFKSVYFVEPQFCTDNAAMIANYALLNANEATPFPQCLTIDARSRFLDKEKHVSKSK